MKTVYSTTLHCQACVAKVKPYLDKVPGLTLWQADITTTPVKVTVEGTASKEDIQAAIELAGYEILGGEEVREEAKPNYKIIILLFTYLSLGTAAAMVAMKHWDAMHAMRYFMAGFFLAFSFFKLMDLQGFALAYARYDILSGAWKPWGFLYPFIELGLGLLYLADMACVYVNSFSLALGVLGLIGVIRVMLRKQRIVCACVGAGFNLPVSTVTLIEDGLMAGMALAMILL